MSISTEIPSQSAIEDFILTNIAGFGQPLKYYNNGEYFSLGGGYHSLRVIISDVTLYVD